MPPNFLAHTKVPEEVNLQTYASWNEPFEVIAYEPGPGSKSTPPAKKPVRYKLPLASTIMPIQLSFSGPPICFAHTKLPAASNFVIKISKFPKEVILKRTKGDGLKSAVP